MIYDTDTRKLYTAAGRPALMLSITRGDALSLMVQLQPPVAGARVAFAARPADNWTGVPGMVAYATTNPQGIAYLSPATITDELDKVLGVGSGRELSQITLSAEVSLVNADNTRLTSHPVSVCYHNNIDRPGDLPGTKSPYPPADKLVTIANVAAIVEREKKGDPGKSAYEIAVAGGYGGTEAQWLESLKGSAVAKGATYKPALTQDTDTTAKITWTNDGGLTNPAPVLLTMPQAEQGLSAYGVAVAGGYRGTESEWLATLKGLPGTPGISAYEVALAGGYNGTEAEWISSLKGPKGDSAILSEDSITHPLQITADGKLGLIVYAEVGNGGEAPASADAVRKAVVTKLDKPSGGTAGQYLRKTDAGTAWDDIPDYDQIIVHIGDQIGMHTTSPGAHDNLFSLKLDKPSGGAAGQYLRKTATGQEWSDIPSSGLTGAEVDAKINMHATGSAAHNALFLGKLDKPSGGATGQFLTKTADGTGWTTGVSAGGNNIYAGMNTYFNLRVSTGGKIYFEPFAGNSNITLTRRDDTLEVNGASSLMIHTTETLYSGNRIGLAAGPGRIMYTDMSLALLYFYFPPTQGNAGDVLTLTDSTGGTAWRAPSAGGGGDCPIATPTTPGKVMPGENMTVDSDGRLSVTAYPRILEVDRLTVTQESQFSGTTIFNHSTYLQGPAYFAGASAFNGITTLSGSITSVAGRLGVDSHIAFNFNTANAYVAMLAGGDSGVTFTRGGASTNSNLARITFDEKVKVNFGGETTRTTKDSPTSADVMNKQMVDTAIAAAMDMASVPVGEIRPFFRKSAPPGWLVCNGAKLLISTYADLYNSDPDLYQTDGLYFFLPDLTNRFLRGKTSDTDVGTVQGDAIRNITGSLAMHSSEKGTIFYGASGAFSGGNQQQYLVPSPAMPTATGSASLTNITFSAASIVPTAAETRPRNMAITYAIKY